MSDSTPPQSTDLELVRRALSDQEELLHLMERYESRLLRYVHRLTGLGQQCVEDVVQEVFIKIYRNLNNFDQALAFSSWAYRIAHNEAMNYIRSNNGRKTLPIETDDEDSLNLADILAGEVDLPDEAARAEQAQLVRSILYTLKPVYRDALILRYLEDQDYAAMSDILQKPMGTIATLLNRAKTQFKQLAQKNNLTLHFAS